MPNEFIARNGIISRGNLIVSGSLVTTQPTTLSGSLSLAGDLNFQAGATRYISMSAAPTAGNGSNLVMQGGDANTGGQGGSLYFRVGLGAGGPGYGSIYIGNQAANSVYPVIELSGPTTIYNSGPNTGTVLTVNGGGQLAMRYDWDNINLVTSAVSSASRILRFTGASQYQVRGSGTTFSTTAFQVQNANASASLSVRDDGLVTVGASIALPVSSYVYWGDVNSSVQHTGAAMNFRVYQSGFGWNFIQADNSTTQASINTGFVRARTGFSATSNSPVTMSGWDGGAGSAGNILLVKGGNSGMGPEYTGGNAGDLILENGLATNNSLGNGGIPGSIIFKYGTYNNTASVEYGRLNSSGSFLIGTTAGSAKLLISGSSNSTLFEIDSPTANNILFVSGSGNVGIRTSSPSVALDVAGNASFGSSQLFKITDNGSGNFDLGGATVNTYINGVTFRVRNASGNTNLYVDGGTNRVGIGTTSPSAKLDVSGSIRIRANYALNSDFSGGVTNVPILSVDSYDSVVLGSTYAAAGVVVLTSGIRYDLKPTGLGINTAGPGASLHILGSGATSSTKSLLIQNANASSSLAVLDNGYVGIGTSSPTTQLEVFSGSAGGTIKVSNGTYSSYWTQGSSYNTTLAFSTQGQITWGNGASFNFVATGDTTLYRIDNGTFVTNNNNAGFYAGRDGYLGFSTYSATSTFNAIGATFADNNTVSLKFFYKSGSVDTEGIRLTSAGNVGIGTTAPTYKLDVSGSTRLNGTGLTTGQHTVATLGFTLSSAGVVSSIGNSYINIYPRGTRTFDIYNPGAGNESTKLLIGNFAAYGVETARYTSAMLVLEAETRGTLLTRTGTTANISSPGQGLITYITASATEGLYYYNSGSYQAWTRVLNDSGSQNITGNLTVTGSFNASSITSSGAIINGNLTVIGTASFTYTTASVVNIGGNLINLNTDNPAARFGGITVTDSGSFGTSSTGSLLWDSQNNRWIYSNPSGSSYDGGLLISGPRNTSGLGSEEGTTLNALMKGQGGDHITSSGVFEVSGNVGIGTSTPSYKLDVAGNIISRNTYPSIYVDHNGTILGGVRADATTKLEFKTLTTAPLSFQVNSDEKMRITDSGTVGIGTYNPTAKLQVKGSGATSSTTAFLVQNSNATASLSVKDDGTTAVLSSNENPFTVSHTNGNSKLAFVLGNGSAIASGQTALRINDALNVFTFDTGRIQVALPMTVGQATGTFRISGGGGGTDVASPAILLTDNTYNAGGYTVTSGTQTTVQIGGFGAPSNSIWKPASGNANYNLLAVAPNMSGSGTYSGTIRGIYYAPTVNSTTYGAHRAIETTAGDVVFNGGRVTISGSAGTGSAVLVQKSGSTVLDIQGSQGQLFSVIDTLSGSLMSVNDISGLPILEVFSDDRIVMGTYGSPALTITGSNAIFTGSVIIDGAFLDTVRTGSLPTGSTLLYTINTGSYQAGFFDYYVSSGSNFRAGTIMSVAGAGTYKFTDQATPDIGNTTNLQFSMSMANANLQLYASASSTGWTVKTTFRTI